MADKKISELDAITGSNTAATDVFVVVDTSTGQTKKITREELNNAIEQDVLSTVDINGGTIDGTTIGASAAAAGSFTTVDATGNITVGGTVDGRDVAADGTKLDGIEASATADQTGAQIATALNGETISSLTALTTTGAVIVGGDFTVNGTTTTINSTTLEVDDKNIVLASGAADAAAANGSGITIDGASATFTYVSTGDKWQLNKPLDVTGGITATALSQFTDVNIPDNNAIRFGNSQDLQIYHDGTNTAIQNGTGELYIYGGNDQIRIRAKNDEESIVANPDGAVTLYYDSAAKLATTSTGIDVTGLIATDGLTSSDLITTTAMSVNHSNGAKFRQYSMNAVAGGGAWLLGKIEHNDNTDGGVSGKLCFAHDYGSTTDSPNIHFTFQQRNGVARGHWWYENTDDDTGSDNVSVKLIDDGSGGMFVWVVASDYVNCSVEASWRQVSESNLSNSGTLSAGTITTGTTLFDTANDPTSEMHIGKLFAHDRILIGTDSGDGFNSDSTLRLQKASGNNYVQIKTASSGQSGILFGDTDDDFVGGFVYANSGNFLEIHASNAERARLESDGDLHVDGNVVAYSTTISDIRLKKDIAPIEDAVTKVQQLNGCTFTYLKDDRQSAGLIAQDVEKVLPSAVIEDEAVFHGEEGETYKTVQYDQVIGLLVEAVKELKQEIEELKNASAE